MKSLLNLLSTTLEDLGGQSSVDTSRDIETVTTRFEDEGISFLTITMPTFGKAFERALDLGDFSLVSTPGFRRRKGLPVFLSGFLELIFDRNTGRILDIPNIHAIRSVRQACLMFGKILLECSEQRVTSAFDKYVKCELELSETTSEITEADLSQFSRVSSVLFSGLFHSVQGFIQDFLLVPKHGPGATAERRVANRKYDAGVWTDRLESVFPYWRYQTSHPYSSDSYSRVEFHEPGAEIPVRVISVPKTLATPRIIAVEPTHMQFMQQGLLKAFRECLREDNILSRMIGLDDQEPNQLLAKKGSLDGSLATLDLSEASDRVSNLLVERLFQPQPHLCDAVQASRSTTADVPGHGVLPLTKFASMGSALCFPVEMFVFLTCIFVGIEKADSIRFTKTSQIAKYLGKVRVFGDDIIVPTNVTASVVSALELFGAKVNHSKSFWTGKFRESCGAEYYDGEDVTICRVRRILPTSRKDAASVESASDLRNQLYKRGHWSVVRWMDESLEALIPYPAIADTSSAIGKYSFLGYTQERICPRLQRPMVRALKVNYVQRESPLDGYGALMKFFITREEKLELLEFQHREERAVKLFNTSGSVVSTDHLKYAGRPISSNLKYGWVYSF